jgi:topoisomerase-4 subunit A
MAKKKFVDNTIILPENLEEIMSDRFARYAKYIIQERALPDARDGLKPVQRRILYAMYREGNFYDKKYRKSAKTVGIVIGNYHPHGDSSVYEAMVRLSQSWKQNVGLVDMQGNNGSIDDDPAAAMRYTEARLSKISQTMLTEINQETVSYTPNFDDTELEPTVLAAQFPLLLVNGATGIAAGYATNIPPHNFNEVVEATIYRIINPTCSIDEITDIIIGPDFPTGGIIQGKEEIKKALSTGRGRVIIKSKVEVVDAKTINQIIVSEIPYETVKVNLVKKMDDIRLNKTIDGITDVRDESDRNGLRIVIDVKKDIDTNLIINYLYKNTDLQTNYNYNMIAIVNKTPTLLNVKDMLDAFINFRKEVILKRSTFNYNQMDNRTHILQGLMKAISILDEVIEVIRASKDKADAKIHLIEAFDFTEIQAEAIVILRLYRLTNTDIKSLRNEFSELVNKMEELKAIIESEDVLNIEVINELKKIREEFNYPRRTKVEDEIEEIVIDKLSMISDEDFIVTVSRDGYVKKVSKRSYNATSDQMTGMKELDELIGFKEVNNKDILLLFTSCGNYIYLPVYEISENKWKDVGNHINKYVTLNVGEAIVNCTSVSTFDTCAYVITTTKMGYMKRTLIADFVVNRTNKVYKAMKLKKDDEMISAIITYENDEIIIVSKTGFTLRYSIDLIPLTKVKGMGVKAIKLMNDDVLAGVSKCDSQLDYLIVFTEDMLTKRVRLTDINHTNRALKGELIAKKVKAKPNYVKFIKACNLYDQLDYISDNTDLSISMKDVSLMNSKSTFSNSLNLNKKDYFLKGIDDVFIKEFTHVEKEVESVHADFDMLDLFSQSK